MANKDFTDYIVHIYRAGERLYHQHHFKAAKDLNNQEYELNGHKYVLELDRAYRTKWNTWSKIIKAEPRIIERKEVWAFKGEKNLWAKREVIITETKKPILRVRPIATVHEILRSKKIGLLKYQEPCTHKCSGCELDCTTIPAKVYPMHVSKIHQPSGELRE